MPGRIRVVIVDDSIVFRTFLQQTLLKDRDIEVIAMFANPTEALDRIPDLSPDVVALDMEMPGMRGDEFLRKALQVNPKFKAVVISALSGNVFSAMQAGAVDFVGKPSSQPGYTNDDFREDVISKIKIAASARGSFSASATAPAPSSGSAVKALNIGSGGLRRVSSRHIVAIGASTGGTEAILQVINHFPKDMPGVVIVQHMPPGFTRMYAERADRVCKMAVREARDQDRVEQGLVLVAPGGQSQCRVVRRGGGYQIELKEEPKVSGHCPSVDVLFESVASAAGANAVGIILTGMGADGAKSLKKLRDAGAHTIGQDEASCVVYGMPKEAYSLGGVVEQLPLSSISAAVVRRFV